MPGFDRTGPQGMGQATGRGFGPCAAPTSRQGLGLGRRRRFGRGRGLGFNFCLNWPQTRQDQTKALADYRKALEEELEDVKKEEQELNKGK